MSEKTLFFIVYLEESGLVVEHDLLHNLIVALALIFEFEVIAEDAGYTLPESGDKPAAKLFDNLVCCKFGFTVNELAEDLAFVECHTFDQRCVLVYDALLDSFDKLFLLLECRNLAQFCLHIGHLVACNLSQRVDLLDGADKAVVSACVDAAIILVEGHHMYRGYRIATFVVYGPLLVPPSATTMQCGSTLCRDARRAEQGEQKQ